MVLYEDKNLIASTSFARNTIKKSLAYPAPIFDIFCSLAHIYAQIFDYENRVTLSVSVHFKKAVSNGVYIEGAKKVGAAIAKKALAAGITEVWIPNAENLCEEETALAEAARKAGLKF